MMSPMTPTVLPTDRIYEPYHRSPESRQTNSNSVNWTTSPIAPSAAVTYSNFPTRSPTLNATTPDVVCSRGLTSTTTRPKRGATRRGAGGARAHTGKSGGGYKHIPHRDKPPHLVARRNARERRRVQAVNSAFARLRKCVPVENRGKRLSKVKTLHRAIEYISDLQDLLNSADGSNYDPQTMASHLQTRSELRRESLTSPEDDIEDEDEDDVETGDDEEFSYIPNYEASLDKENENGQSWIPLGANCDPNYGPYIPYYDEYSGSLTS